jgi:hypothetical protein
MKPVTRRTIAGMLALAGTSLCAAIYMGAITSKKPSRSKPASANIAGLAPGRVMSLDAGALRYFIIKSSVNELHVVACPVESGKVPMPEVHWWKPLMRCKDFGLDVGTGPVNAQSRFRCRDSDQPEEWASRWQWDSHGRHIPAADGMKVDDMYRVKIERDDDDITFVGLESD